MQFPEGDVQYDDPDVTQQECLPPHLQEISDSFYRNFSYTRFIGQGGYDLDFCVANLTAFCQITQTSDEPSAAKKIDWVTHVILMRDSLMSHMDVQLLNEQERDKKRRTFSIVADKVGNYVVNKFLYLQKDPQECETSYLSRLIYNADLTSIKRLNYAIWVKAEYRIVLKPLNPDDVTEEQLEGPWQTRVDSINQSNFLNTNLLMSNVRRKTGESKRQKLPSSSGSVVLHPPPVSYKEPSPPLAIGIPQHLLRSSSARKESTVKYQGMENFMIEQLAVYCRSQELDPGQPTTWMIVLPAMREYCSNTPTFYEPDLKKRYRVHNLFIDNVAHFVVNKYIQVTGQGFQHFPGIDKDIDPNGHEGYVNRIVRKSSLDDILDLNYTLFIKDDSRYPIKPVPPFTTLQQINDAWNARLCITQKQDKSSVDGMLMKLTLHQGRRAQILSCKSFNPLSFPRVEADEEDGGPEGGEGGPGEITVAGAGGAAMAEAINLTSVLPPPPTVLARQELSVPVPARVRLRIPVPVSVVDSDGEKYRRNVPLSSSVGNDSSSSSLEPNTENVVYQPNKRRRSSNAILVSKILQAVAADTDPTTDSLSLAVIEFYAKVAERTINDSSEEDYSDYEDFDMHGKYKDYNTRFLENIEDR